MDKIIDDLIKANEKIKKLEQELDKFEESVFLLSLAAGFRPTSSIFFSEKDYEKIIKGKSIKFIVEEYLNIELSNKKDSSEFIAESISDFQKKFMKKWLA